MPHKWPQKWCALHFGDLAEARHTWTDKQKAAFFDDLVDSGLMDSEPKHPLVKLQIQRSWGLIEEKKERQLEWKKARAKESGETKKELKEERMKNKQLELNLATPPPRREAAKLADLPVVPKHEMLKFALANGMAQADFEIWHEDREKTRWLDGTGKQIRNWQLYLLKSPQRTKPAGNGTTAHKGKENT